MVGFPTQGIGGKVDGEDITPNSVTIQNSVTVFVRSTGSDTNDGLTATNAKATITDAIRDAPIHGPRDTLLTIDVQETATFTENVNLNEWNIPELVIIQGNGQTNDANTTTIDGNGADHVIFVERANVVLKDLHVTGGGPDNIVLSENANVQCENVSALDPNEHNAEIRNQSYFEMDANCDFNQSAVAGADSNIRVFDSVAQLNGTIEGDGGGNAVVQAWEGSVVFLESGATVNGEGSGNTDHIFELRDSSVVKTADFVTDGAREVFRVEESSIARNNAAITQTDVTRRWDVIHGGVGRDEENGEQIMALPRFNGDPTGMYDGTTGGARAGWVWYNQTENLPVAHDGGVGAGIPMATNERADPASGDLIAGEFCFDTTNNRWLYKDRSGTVHFWNRDGTVT